MADEVVQIVKVLDGLNRFRFADQPDLLAGWEAASNIIGPPRTGGQADGPTVRHASASRPDPAGGVTMEKLAARSET